MALPRSAEGHSRQFWPVHLMSAYPLTAAEKQTSSNRCLGPEPDTFYARQGSRLVTIREERDEPSALLAQDADRHPADRNRHFSADLYSAQQQLNSLLVLQARPASSYEERAT